MSNVHLLIIDPQKDFCDTDGALSVPGAAADMERLRDMIMKDYDTISGITISIDTHSYYHIAHQMFWVNEAGEHPPLLTTIRVKDVEAGHWRAANSQHADWALKYVIALAENGRYELTIWPSHCISGTEGFLLCDAVQEAIKFYEEKTKTSVTYVFKGSNPLTEHYSIFKADVCVPGDRLTELNTEYFKEMTKSDKILVAGEALSHCVANSIMDIATVMSDDLSKVILLDDCSSNVSGFASLGDDFVKKAMSMGMTCVASKNFREHI